MTNKEAILKILQQDEDIKEYMQNQNNAGLTCGEITDVIASSKESSSRYLSGSISSILRKLVKL